MKFKLSSIILIVIIFSNCKQDKIPDVYYPGVITIRANSDFRNGMITSLDVFANDEDFENLGRAIIYKYNEGDSFFDLNDTVLFKIKENEILQAYDIRKNNIYVGEYKIENANFLKNIKKLYSNKVLFEKVLINGKPPKESGTYFLKLSGGKAKEIKKFKTEIFASFDQVYNIRNKYKLNLHTADEHREGPQHKIWHVKPPKYSYTIEGPLDFRDYKAMVLYDDSRDTTYAIIYDPNSVSTDSEIDYFLYPKSKPPSFVIDANSYPTITDITLLNKFMSPDIKFYDISTSHDHTLNN